MSIGNLFSLTRGPIRDYLAGQGIRIANRSSSAITVLETSPLVAGLLPITNHIIGHSTYITNRLCRIY